jgi:hypothetical protein
MFKSGRLVGKLMRRESLAMMGWDVEGILALEMLGGDSMRIEAMKMAGRGLAGMQTTFRSRQRQRGSEAEDESGRVKVTSLVVVERVGAAWSGCIVPRRLIRKSREGEAVWI